jgi:hypothetical protein
VLDAEVVIFEIHIQIGVDELLLDEVPDDAGHLVAVEFDDGSRDLDLNLARGADADSEIVWSAAAGGSLPAAGAAEQTGEAVLGYRLQPLDIVTLTTEIALAGRYTFATQNGLAGSLTPRVKVVADLTQPLATPWRTTLDVSVGRQVPMVGRDIQTSGTALLKLELPTP